MSKRSYTDIKKNEAKILEMKAGGFTNQEIGDHFGLKAEQIKSFLKQCRGRERKLSAGVLPRSKGRPRKETPCEELERLRMENKLLRDFLQLTERM